MFLNWKSYWSCKISVIVAFVAIWNVLFLISMFISGSFMGPISREGSIVVAFTLFSAALFAISVATSKRVRSLVIETKRRHLYSSNEFWFLAFVCSILGAFNVFNAFTGVFTFEDV